MMRLLCWLLLLGVGGAWAQTTAPAAPAPAPPKARVYYALDNTSISPVREVNARTVRRMVDSLICGLTGKSTVGEAWRTLVSPKDRVGIKVAASGKTVSGTNPEVVQAIADGLREAGVPSRNIIVWDRNMDDLLVAGYEKNGSSYVLEAIDPTTGYDQQAIVSAPMIGKLIWGDSKFGNKKGARLVDLLSNGDQLSSQSFYAKILSQEVTKVINVPSLMDSYTTGINGAIVNMTLSNLDNWRRFSKSAAEGDSYIAEIYADAMVHDKVVLTIMDGLVLQYAGGPFPNPNFALNNYTLFASTDPVAIDATAVRLIDEARLANKMPSIKPMSAYVEAAAQMGLGEYAEPRIQMIRVGVEGIR